MADDETERRQRITGKLVRPGEDAEAFDVQFWRAMSGEQRVEALWGMVRDAIVMKGGDPDVSLHKAVGRVMRPGARRSEAD